MSPVLAVRGECSRTTCFAPDTACVLGQVPCPNFVADNPVASNIGSTEGRPLPWSGLALGLADLSAVAAIGRSHFVAIVGAPNAGKTTLLAAHWLAARRGTGEFGSRFAGSYTLIGWHQIGRHLQWVPHGRGFPPHTTAPDNRTPALLHMALNMGLDNTRQILYTDVPGEWYSEWAYDAGDAPGVQWIADAADAFVILADSAALSGPDRGIARGNYETLAHRLKAAANGRPVIPVQTKVDNAVPDLIQTFLNDLNMRLFGRPTIRVSVHNASSQPLTSPVDQGVLAALAPKKASLAYDRTKSDDPFLAFRFDREKP
ncbi:hypothetical protein CLV70_12624 [Pseudosporangium ferrugineum]|uniref:Double-GTPase 2 domain-containing protein n=1 Tax=Pseudosporangium ferrugineum TaxID=439699 RepID=A0A2T0RFK5_9ACTN|nr:hypothetical protein CLV70_12624 [Pseudosporangium ferrugineum]